VLFTANYTKLYRHSYFADYYVLNVKEKTTVALIDGQVGGMSPPFSLQIQTKSKIDVQYAAWSPTGNTIAYVMGNNLFIWENGTSTQITKDGGPDVFNAIPDWVYEEEIFGDRYTLWFSPDGKKLAFLRFDETGVPTFQIPYYLAHGNVAPPYPEYLQLRYPKVGKRIRLFRFICLILRIWLRGRRRCSSRVLGKRN
jgi:dipeptidyl-peptidase-4